MQKLIAKYGLAAHLALVAVAPLFLCPSAVLWISLLGAVFLVMEPSCLGRETLHEARTRTLRAVVRDPAFWVLFALLLIALVSFLNGGVDLAYDAQLASWTIGTGSFPLLPSSRSGSDASLVACATAALVVMTGARHALGKSARLAFCLSASFLAAVGAGVCTFLIQDGSAAFRQLAECSFLNPSFAGSAYGLYLLAATAALSMTFEKRWFSAIPFAFVAVAGNAMGLFVFAPTALILFYASLALVLFVYSFFYLRVKGTNNLDFKCLVIFSLAVALAALGILSLLPKDLIDLKIAAFSTGAWLPDGFFETRRALGDLSFRAWRENPYLGFGFGSFDLVLQFFASPADWERLSSLQQAPLNGYWMILLQGGVVAAFSLLVIVSLSVVSYMIALVRGVAAALPAPLAWTGLLALLAAVPELLFDASYLSPGAAVALAALLSVSCAAFPKERKSHG